MNALNYRPFTYPSKFAVLKFATVTCKKTQNLSTYTYVLENLNKNSIAYIQCGPSMTY